MGNERVWGVVGTQGWWTVDWVEALRDGKVLNLRLEIEIGVTLGYCAGYP